jgi:lipopolysaccharide export system permease protein
MPNILYRYILKEVVQTWFVVTLVLLLILVTNQFAQVLGDAAASRLPKQAIILVMGLSSLQYLTILVPVGLFLAIMMALGRLYRDSEMAAMMACGIGPLGLYRPLVVLSIVLALVVGWLALVVSPTAVRQIESIAIRAKQQADLGMLEPGRFINFGKGDAVMYAESVDKDGALLNVFVQRRIENRVEVIVAERAWQSDSEKDDVQVLQFFRGSRYEGEPGNSRFRVVEFVEHGIPFVRPTTDPTETDPETRSLVLLLDSDNPMDKAELQWRASLPITLLVLTVLAVPLSRSAPRQGRYGGLVYGVLIYIIYVNLLGAAKVWTEQETIPAYLGVWWVHALMLLVALLFAARQFGSLRRSVFRWPLLEASS